jgi:hypothetical protein
MKLPQLTAAQSLCFRNSDYRPGARGADQPGRVVMMVSVECLNGCVGATAYDCIQRCGSDMACWNKCAGPASMSCVEACYSAG